MVLHAKLHPIVSQPGRDRRPGRKLECALDERSDLRDVLQLIERAHGIGFSRVARRVREVLAVVAQPLEVDARGQSMRERTERRGVRDAGSGPVVDAIEIDVRRSDRILEIAAQPEHGERGLAAVRRGSTQRGAALDLCHGLARVPGQIERRRLVPVRNQLGACESPWIVGPRVVSQIGHQRERPAIRQRQPETRVQDALVRRAVVALSLVIESRDRERGAPSAHAHPGRRLPLVPRAAGSCAELARDKPRVLTNALDLLRTGPNADDTAGRVAEQRR